MESGIVIALILGGASVVSSICFGFIPSIRRGKVEQLELKIQRLLWNMKLYHEIEDELLDRLENTTGQNKLETQRSVRKMVSNNNGGRVLSDECTPSVYNKQIK